MTYYDDIAEGYNELHREEQTKKFRVIQDYVEPSSHVLDVGFGTGLSDELLRSRITGIEPSEGMVAAYEGECNVVVDKAENIPWYFAEDEFDATICVSTAHHFEDHEAVFEAIQRVTKSDGIVAVSVFKDAEDIIQYVRRTFKVIHTEVVQRDAVLILRNA